MDLKTKGCLILSGKNMSISAIIPAYNEEKTIKSIVRQVKEYVDEVIVVDDGSSDNTAKIAEDEGAIIISHLHNKGYIEALRSGAKKVSGDIVVTLDADGQHNPADIPKLIKPISENQADLIIGAREKVSMFSEKLLKRLTNLVVQTSDASCGFKAIRRTLLDKMQIKGKCICGTFIIEAFEKGGRIGEVKIKIKERKGKRRIHTKHIFQTFIVLWEIMKIRIKILKERIKTE